MVTACCKQLGWLAWIAADILLSFSDVKFQEPGIVSFPVQDTLLQQLVSPTQHVKSQHSMLRGWVGLEWYGH
jgi:hypothetical protein